MNDATGETDPYQIVLRDLRAQRSKIDDAISAIERVLGINSPTVMQHTTLPGGQSTAPDVQASSSTGAFVATDKKALASYAGLTIYEAAKKELERAQDELTNSEITHGIIKGGLSLNSADPLNTVASVLTRRFYDHGDIVRVARGTWGLPEWYSDHDFRAEALKSRESRNTKGAKASPARTLTSEPEQPSEPQRSAPQNLDSFFELDRQPNRA